MRVYKYIDHHALDVIRDCRVKVSEPHRLNDPFELSPKFSESTYTLENTEEILRQEHIIQGEFDSRGQQRGFALYPEYRKWHLNHLRQLAEETMPSLPDNVESVRVSFAESTGKAWRLLCASKTNRSILMWSHYAQMHEGAVIELDTDKPDLDKANGECTIEVKYSEEKPEFTYRSDEAGFKEEFLRVVQTKAKDWAYEEEIRLAFPWGDFVRTNSGDFVPIARSAIRSVIMGCRTPPEFIARMLEVLRNKDYKHVDVYKAEQSKAKYELEFQPIKR